MRIQPWTEKQLMSREDVLEALTTKALRLTMRRVSEDVRAAVLTAAAAPAEPAPGVSYTALEGAVMATWAGFVDRELFPFITDTFMESSEKIVTGLEEAGAAVADTLTNAYASEFLQYAYNRMVGIGEDLWLNIRKELEEGFAAGEGIKEVAARLTQVAGLTEPRAKTVARTEMISAANAGSYLQVVAAGFDSSDTTKIWLATEDTRTRLSHRHADEQDVPLLDEFSVDIYSGDVKTGSEEMEFPGDPVATPGNVINCRCSLAFEFSDDEDGMFTAAAFIEKEHPRKHDGKFKKKGAPDGFLKIPDLLDKPSNSASTAEKVVWMAEHKWDHMTAGQKGVLIKSITPEDWAKIPPALKTKIMDAPSTTSHPESKNALLKDVAALADLPDVTPAGRPQGGVDTKTGKALSPGKPVKLRVQLLYNTSFEDGAVMAVRKDSDERLIWNGKKIERQKKDADGKFATTDTKTRGDAYKAWKDEDGWTIPTAGEATSAPEAPTVTGGKPIYLRVQTIYNTKYNDGDVVAVNPGTGETITWDAKKKRMVVSAGGVLPDKEYTRGALYKEFKDEEGWFTPGAGVEIPPAPAVVPPAAPAVKAPAAPEVPAAAPSFAASMKLARAKAQVGEAIHYENGVWINKSEKGVIVQKGGNVTQVTTAKLDDENLKAAFEKVGATYPGAPEPFKKFDLINDENNDAMHAALDDPAVPNGTLLFESSHNGETTKITKVGDGKAAVTDNDGPPAFINSDEFSSLNLVSKIVEAKNNAKTGKGGGSNAAPEAAQSVLPVQEGYFGKGAATAIKQKAQKSSVAIGTDLYEDDEILVYKGANGKVGVTPKGGSAPPLTIPAEDITDATLSALVAKVSGDILSPAPARAPTPAYDNGPLGQLPDLADLKDTGKVVGTHHGKIYKDSKGNTWLFKAAPSGFSAAAEVDLATAKLHSLAGFQTPITGIVKLNGQTGSLQKIYPDVSEPFDYAMNGHFTAHEAFSIQAEHAFDWLTANHDAHAKNLLKDPSGEFIGIDKGQAFKYFGADKLDWNFQPNEHPQAALQLYKQYASGKDVPISDPSKGELAKSIAQIQAIPDDQYRAILRPYAESAARSGKLAIGGPSYLGMGKVPFQANDVEAFLDAAVARKHALNTDLKAFYDKAKAEHDLHKYGSLPPVFTPDPAAIQSSTPKGVPMQLGYSVLVNPKTTQYPHGKVIAENPSQNERIIWNGFSKKYVIQSKNGADQWVPTHTYTKQGAYKNLKNDPGWLTPTETQDSSGASTPVPTIQSGDPAVSITAPGKSPLAKKTPKFSVADLQAQADSTADFSPSQIKGLYQNFRSNGGKNDLSSFVKLSSSGSAMFEAALEAQSIHNKNHPGQRVSLLQVLRAVDQQASTNASTTNNNLFEKKVVAWLGTPSGKTAAQNVHTNFKLSPAAKKQVELSKALASFQTKSDNKAQGTAAYKKIDAMLNAYTVAPHTSSSKYPVPSKDQAFELHAQMIADKPWTDAEKAAIKSYTSSSDTMNAYMRTFGNTSSGGTSAKRIQEAMRPAPENMMVYRNSYSVFDDKWKPSVEELSPTIGKAFYEDGFSSTTISPSVFGGRPYQYQIEVPKGTPVAWAQASTHHPNEQEFILGAGLKFEVLSAHKAGFVTVIKMRVVPA